MNKYIPDSILLDNIFLPTNIPPKIGREFVIDTNNPSVIKLNNIPYIDLNKFDLNTRDWFFYDSNGLSFSLQKNIDNINWDLVSYYDIGQHTNEILTINQNIKYNKDGKNLGFYVNINKINNINISYDLRFYCGNPLFVKINGNIFKDITDYNDKTLPNLTEFNTDLNKEFYYKFNTNEIVTNQNLLQYNIKSIEVYYYYLPNEVSVKCNLKSNGMLNTYSTPYIDYYIIKLHGQDL